MLTLRRWLPTIVGDSYDSTPTVGTRLASILLTGAALALALIFIGISITVQLQGDGEAINEAGKLRMQAYRIGHHLRQVAEAPPNDRVRLWYQLQDDVRAYDRRLQFQNDYLAQGFLASIALPHETHPTIEAIQESWLRRKARLPTSASAVGLDDVRTYNEGLGGFVDRVDRYVGLLQRSTTTKLNRYYLTLLGFTVLAVFIGLLSFLRTRHYLTRPLQYLRDCASRIAAGDLAGCRAPRTDTAELDQLAHAFNHMAEELTELKHGLDSQVAKQTHSLQQRNQRLSMLYEIATSLQTNLPVEELVVRALDQTIEVTESSAGIARLVTSEGDLRLVGSRGLEPHLLANEKLISMDRCLCGQSAQIGETRHRDDLAPCEKRLGGRLPCSRESGLFAVPIKHKERVLGLFTLFGTPHQDHQEEIESLLETVTNHVGLAIENRRLAAEAQRASLMEERNLLASELHDSIAQCLASAKLQIWMLEGELGSEQSEHVHDLVLKIRKSVESGYSNLRDLLAHFRTRIDERGLIPALNELIENVQDRTHLNIALLGPEHTLELSPDEEIQVFHIIHEALSNIEKHAGAENVRILVREEPETYHFLVEDDGVGMDLERTQGQRRDHFGLSIMHERTLRLNGHLDIESASGEGTHITLSIPRVGASTIPSDEPGKEEPIHAYIPGR